MTDIQSEVPKMELALGSLVVVSFEAGKTRPMVVVQYRAAEGDSPAEITLASPDQVR